MSLVIIAGFGLLPTYHFI